MRPVRAGTRSKRLRVLVLVGFGVLLVLFLSASGIAQVYTDWLWFSHLDLGSVWRTIVGTQIALVLVFSLVFFLLLWSNLYLADRLAPSFRAESPEEDLIERYHELVGAHTGKIRLTVSAVFALVAGVNTSGEWQKWLLFRNGSDFGWTDPQFGKDAGFYVFELPFWTFLIDWFFAALVFSLLVSLIAHYLNGGIRASATPAQRFTVGVKLHVSGLLAVLAVLRAGAYWFDRFELVASTRGVLDGAFTTDVEVQLPALQLLSLISLFGAVLFLANVWRKGWGLPLVAMGLWAVSHVVIGGIYPALYERLRVVPEQSTREAPFIERNIAATRFAYGLDEDNLTRESYEYQPSLTTEDVEAAADILEDVALIDAALATESFTRSQGERQWYEFGSRLDIDRYMVDGNLEPVVMSARNLNLDGVDAGWENEHVAFTHGYGVAAAAGANVVKEDNEDSSELIYYISGTGPNLSVAEGFDARLDQPQLYFGEDLGGYAIVGATRGEVDYPTNAQDALFRYDGDGGVPLGSFLRRTAFSLRFQQFEPLISNFVTSDSRVIYNRDIEDRVNQIAPFLQFDSDPYPVVLDGRVVYVIDAYTTTSDFPYSQRVSGGSVPGGADLRSGYNYIRNSVKAVVDGYDGTVTMYVIDDDDPIIAAYARAFPDLFTPSEDVPAGLADHFRYPADIFRVQTEMWATYQVTNPVQFLQGELAWSVATQPSDTSSGEATTTSGNQNPMFPQYRVTRLPGETESEFVVQRAFVPRSSSDSASERPELTAVIVGRSDPGHYGELVLYELPDGQVAAPDLVHSEIQKESVISGYITPLDLQGSTVLFGEMQMVLMADTVVYVRPLYVEADATVAVPKLTRVIAVNGDRIFMASTLDEAIAGVTANGAPPDPPVTTDDESDSPEISTDFEGMSVADLVGSVDELLARADTAEANDNVEEAARLRAEARAANEQLARVLGIEPTPAESDTGEA